NRPVKHILASHRFTRLKTGPKTTFMGMNRPAGKGSFLYLPPSRPATYPFAACRFPVLLLFHNSGKQEPKMPNVCIREARMYSPLETSPHPHPLYRQEHQWAYRWQCVTHFFGYTSEGVHDIPHKGISVHLHQAEHR